MIFHETLALLSSKSLDSGSVHVWERKLSGMNRTHSAHGTVSPDNLGLMTHGIILNSEGYPQ